MEENNQKYKNISPFRFFKKKNFYFITNDVGAYARLSEEKFNEYIEDRLDKNSPEYQDLCEKGFILEGFSMEKASEDFYKKRQYLSAGPTLHIMVLTLRCNHRCIYCHASAQDMSAKETDMDKNTAAKVLDKIFQSTSNFIAIEFQGGEPMVNWPIIEYVVKEAKKKAKETGKEVELRLVSNFSLMTDEKFDYLIKNKVSMCTSLDGPKELHNKNRPMAGDMDGHKNIDNWIKKFNDIYPSIKEKGYINKMGAIVVISKYSLNYHKEIIDEYIRSGFSSIFLRPLNPFGHSGESWEQTSYKIDDFIDFYKKTLDYIIDINLAGTYFEEKLAKVFLAKIITPGDPNMMEIRNPCGAGIGQLAYNYNGDVYTCDEGRMMSMMGDESFKIGNVAENTYEEMVSSPVTRTLCSASCLESLPYCSDCAYLPYCGVCPIYNYFEQGNIFGQMPNNERCKMNMAILDHLFEKMEDKKIKNIFYDWVT